MKFSVCLLIERIKIEKKTRAHLMSFAYYEVSLIV